MGSRLAARRLLRSNSVRLGLLLFALVTFFDTLRLQNRIARHDLVPHAFDTPRKHERVYIAALHYNDAPLLRQQWNPALLALVERLGRANVFVNVHESGSWDDTKAALAELDAELEVRGVPRSVITSNVTHQDELEANRPAQGAGLPEGWIVPSKGAKPEMRRIPFLANLRNSALRDLDDLHEKGFKFDKVLFLNDVLFTPEDALTLLDTNRGVYAAACSLDFSDPPLFYDTFALRDANGHAHLTPTWPYFRATASRNAVLAHADAVPVTSCWNGIVAMPAAPFTSPIESKRLRFRAIPDSLAQLHLEASECCLIHADNPLSADLGVYLNPRVRVGYNVMAYAATHPGPGRSWLSGWAIGRGRTVNRLLGWFTSTRFTDRRVDDRLAQWKAEEQDRDEPGRACLINEAHFLAPNGWMHL
ncbi:hypothetical protein D7B24_000158 [Verticillium nonalfalfae]|uniref:Polysaccharide export protein n=1 Tax=Verticillium nonalfalfae TaxID=1051616 RepID=A0A3M9YMU4_9PEZI|nr:uncharacterized protein D7B24_000158 [Verticillium nonalfalfae]RNJ61302.1 hypothetical protein D7B24_000158 [Verticillium nonalfalfae]